MECPYCGCGERDYVRVGADRKWALRCLDCLSQGPVADSTNTAYEKWDDRYESTLVRLERLVGIAIQKIEGKYKYRCFFCGTVTQLTSKGHECPKCGGRPA